MRRLISLVLLFACIPVAAHADETRYDRIRLSTSVESKVENDTIIVTLYAQEEGRQVLPLSQQVNADVRWALDAVRRDGRFQVQTGTYTTYPVYHAQKISGWRVRQSMSIEGTALDQVGELLVTLQQRLAIQGMRFAVSAELRKQTEDTLIVDALNAFQYRAELVAKRMQGQGYRIVEVNLDTSGGHPQYPQSPRVVMMEAAPAAPAIASGEQVMRVTAGGTIELER